MFIGRGEGDVRMEDLQLRATHEKYGRHREKKTGYYQSVLNVETENVRRKENSLKIQMKIFNAIVIPVLLYGAIVRALTRTEERRLNAFEMSMLRSILGVRWDDFVRNAVIRDMLR